MKTSLEQAGEVMDQWGCRGSPTTRNNMKGAFSQVFLINRSPLLEDLTTERFVRRLAHPATSAFQAPFTFALQRAVASLGHCDP
ncbi:MAG: tyrosine-type recombinase/integrase, partial [Nitrososphaerales archaeon]